MILCFPDLDTFRLAAAGSLLPADVVLAPARVRFEDDGRIHLQTDAKITKKLAGELARLAVTVTKVLPEPSEELSCWLQAIEAEPDSAPLLSTHAPVIFEVPDPKQLPQLVGEMLRLGNDRQSYCWLETGRAKHMLLRVIGPPYYTLLQSLDPQFSGSSETLTAFVEQGPRVWVQIGYQHPVARRIKLPDEQMVLIRPGRQWTYLDDPPFRDIYDVLQFPLPGVPITWQSVPTPEKLTVPLKLASGNAAEVPEFWVLRSQAAKHLDTFVRDADDRLLQRLRFAVSEASGNAESVIVLRLSPSKLPAPVLELPGAVGYKPYFKLTNLFVPTGLRLHPQLRRDAVRTLLASDPDRVVWLSPLPNGEFLPESIAEEAFRPLDHWVDYILESSPAPLKAWVAATQFDFESFVCADQASKPRGPDRGPKDRGRGKETDSLIPLQPETPPVAVDPNATAGFTTTTPKPVDDALKVDAWKLRRAALQDEFQKLEGGLDQPERQSLWPALARANTGAGDPAEASICWVNAMWEQVALPAEFVQGWYQTEHPNQSKPNGATELDTLLQSRNPDRIEVRQLASTVLASLSTDPAPAWLRSRLPAIQQYLEANDGKLPVRAVWLIALELATVTGADVLGLARVRDRILQRLLDGGLNAETDLPFFLRTAGLKDSERVRFVRDQAMSLHQLCRKWAEATNFASYAYGFKQSDAKSTLPYVDLLFAYGFAKLGEATTARTLMDKTRRSLDPNPKSDERLMTKKYLYEAFLYRAEEVLAGKVPSRALPVELAKDIELLAIAGRNVDNSPHKNAYKAIMRLRAQSVILEPIEKYDHLDKAAQGGNPFLDALRDLSDIRDPSNMIRQVRMLYRGGIGGNEPQPLLVVQMMTLHAAMPWAVRAGEGFTLELLSLVPEVLRQSLALGAVKNLTKIQGELLDRALFFAAHFGRRDHIQTLQGLFIDLVASKQKEDRIDMINLAARQCMKCLVQAGLRDEIDTILLRLYNLILQGESLPQLKTRWLSRQIEWGRLLQALLHLASGWSHSGNADMANPILDEARAELLAPAKPVGTQANVLIPVFYTKLAKSYIAAIGQGQSETGLNRLSELFVQMDPKRLTIGGTNARFYSELHIAIVEEVVLAIVSDDFALGPGGRRWLDEDEFLVRRRIHRDMQSTLTKSRL